MNEKTQGQIRGCLLGVAIGDALGAPFEGVGNTMSHPKLKISGGRIEDFHPFDGHPAGTWTDDTGMTLAVCEALIDYEKTGKDLENCFRRAFKTWASSPDCIRPGVTVYQSSKSGITDENSWANGALMRTAPVAIYAHVKGLDNYKAAELAMFVAMITHGHPLATLPAVECVLALMSIFGGEDLVPKDLSEPWRFCKDAENDERVKEYKRLRSLPLGNIDPSTGLFMWKQVFEKCLELRPGVPWRLPSFEEGILKTVNDSIDRDTAGAVAGGLLGAYCGFPSILLKWVKKVTRGEEILALADKMVHLNV